LLRFLDVGLRFDHEYKGPTMQDLREYTELMRRSTIPFYEETRLCFARAEAEGDFAGANSDHIYSPNHLESLIEEYEGEHGI